MTRNRIVNEYFNWLSNLVCGKRYSKDVSYKKLISYLHSIDFIFTLPMDQNRALDGIELRWRFATEKGYTSEYPEIMDALYSPCSVLEMMIALAIRCEEEYMDDPTIGDRTGQWFWGMVVNLGLGSMIDIRFDEEYVDMVVDRFLEREYEPDGRGGLFTIRDCEYDLRDEEIWTQLCWYINTLV